MVWILLTGVSRFFKINSHAGKVILYFVALLLVSFPIGWNLSSPAGGGDGAVPSGQMIFSLVRYMGLLTLIALAVSSGICRLRSSVSDSVFWGLAGAVAACYGLFNVLFPGITSGLDPADAAHKVELIIILLAGGVLILISGFLVYWLSGFLYRAKRGFPLAVVWGIFLIAPVLLSLSLDDVTTGTEPSGNQLGGRNANVVLISVDTLRSDDLGCFGGTITSTPSIDELAGSSSVFTNAVTPIPVTGPAHISMLTGLQPDRTYGHGVETNGVVLGSDVDTLASVLDGHGYRTAGIIGGSPLAREACGLQRGFHYYNDTFETGLLSRIFPQYCWSLQVSRVWRKLFAGGGVGVNWLKKPAEDVTDQAIEWLEENSDQPFFLFTHYYDPHKPLDPADEFESLYSQEASGNPDEYRDRHPVSNEWESEPVRYTDEALARARALYRGEVSYADANIGRLLSWLRENNLWNDTLVIFVADHGEAFGSRYVGHVNRLYESIVHVPLVIHNPGTNMSVAGPAEIDDLVCISDIFYTALDYLEIDPPVQPETVHDSVPGSIDLWDHSLLGLIDSYEEPVPVFFDEGYQEEAGNAGWDYIPMRTHGVATESAVEVGRMYGFRYADSVLIYSPEATGYYPLYQYFDIEGDPLQRIDLFPSIDWSVMEYPDAVSELAMWANIRAANNKSYRIDPRITEQLRALGYVQ